MIRTMTSGRNSFRDAIEVHALVEIVIHRSLGFVLGRIAKQD